MSVMRGHKERLGDRGVHATKAPQVPSEVTPVLRTGNSIGVSSSETLLCLKAWCSAFRPLN
jgi:hypothetical protein